MGGAVSLSEPWVEHWSWKLWGLARGGMGFTSVLPHSTPSFPMNMAKNIIFHSLINVFMLKCSRQSTSSTFSKYKFIKMIKTGKKCKKLYFSCHWWNAAFCWPSILPWNRLACWSMSLNIKFNQILTYFYPPQYQKPVLCPDLANSFNVSPWNFC